MARKPWSEEERLHYSIRHITRFRYTAPVRESVMELRMQPRSEGPQALRSFQIVTNPRAQLYAYTDHLGNAVYHFNMLREHEELRIEAQATVEITHGKDWPEALDPLEWSRYNSFNLTDDHFDMLGPSRFARSSRELESFKKIADLEKPVGDPLTALRTLQRGIYDSFDYEPGVTEVNSPIEVALEQRRGVCQDFAHIMTAIARDWGIPCRYVSGYLYHKGSRDRSALDVRPAGRRGWRIESRVRRTHDRQRRRRRGRRTATVPHRARALRAERHRDVDRGPRSQEDLRYRAA